MDLAPFLTFGFAMAALAGFVSGVVRGFTGFGANLVWAPVLVTVMDPIQALAIMGMVGLAGTVQIAIPVAKVADWNGLYPIIYKFYVIPLRIRVNGNPCIVYKDMNLAKL